MRLTPAERLLLAQQRQAPGITGTIANAAPVRPRPRGDVVQGGSPAEAVFDFSGGPLIVSTSNVYPARGGEEFVTLDATLTQSLTASADVEVLVNGTAADTVTLPTGVTFDSQSVSLGSLAAGDLVQARISAPGSGGAGLVVVLRQA